MFKKLLAILIAGAFIFSLAIPAFAQEAQGKAADDQAIVITEQTPASKDAIEVGNKICPVSGEKIPTPGEKGAMADKPVKVEYKGKIYNLCCPMCIPMFKKDPEKYIKKIEEQEHAGSDKQEAHDMKTMESQESPDSGHHMH